MDKVGEPRDCATEAFSGPGPLGLRAKGVSKVADPEAPTPVHMNLVHVCFPEPSFPHSGCRIGREGGRGGSEGKGTLRAYSAKPEG